MWDIVRHFNFHRLKNTGSHNFFFFFQFRIYIGLLQQSPAPPKDATADAGGEAGSDDTDSDSGDSDDAMANGKDDGNRMETFLNDPELSMKIFFSSHFRERGLIW